MADQLAHARALLELGKRAVRYYVDTGLCVFCSADDCEGEPHEDHCNVGELSGVVVDGERKQQKAAEREAIDFLIAALVLGQADGRHG